MGWKVIIAPSAQADLESIVRFIAEHNRDATARVGYELTVRAEGLAALPEIGRIVPEFKRWICAKSFTAPIASSIACAATPRRSRSSASGTPHAVSLKSLPRTEQCPRLGPPFHSQGNFGSVKG